MTKDEQFIKAHKYNENECKAYYEGVNDERVRSKKLIDALKKMSNHIPVNCDCDLVARQALKNYDPNQSL